MGEQPKASEESKLLLGGGGGGEEGEGAPHGRKPGLRVGIKSIYFLCYTYLEQSDSNKLSWVSFHIHAEAIRFIAYVYL